KSMGHFMEHGGLYHNKDFCAGDMMRLQRYSDMGAIDAVFKQFVMGQKHCTKAPWADDPVWQTPKIASSISHVFGKQDDIAMVEIFGARGQDLTYREMKWWADHMQVCGVNVLIPHSFNPRAPYDDDCPPYFYNGGFEPRWPLYRVFADYTSRLSLMLTGGRHVCPVAILFNGNLGQVGKMVPPEGISEALQDAQIDCDWLPMDVFEKDAVIEPRPAAASGAGNAELQLHGERYRVLIIPPVEVIRYETLAKVKEFFDNGGIVMTYGFVPTKSATIGKTTSDIASLCRGMWGENGSLYSSSRSIRGGSSDFCDTESAIIAELRAALGIDAGCTIEPPTPASGGWLHILHRRKLERDIFLVTNQTHQGTATRCTFHNVTERPDCWDPVRNEITVPQIRRASGRALNVTISLEPLETVLLVFQPEKSTRSPRIEPDTKPIRESIAIVRDGNPLAKGDSPIFADTKIGTVPAPKPDIKRKPLTLSPVKAADPFRGRATLPADVDLAKCRVCLEMDDLPDEAAAVTVNGQKAGGLIGRPLRLDITRHLKPGENSVLIEPLAPKAARLTFYAP
ncbi:MAG: hypothetical protein LLG00_00260, partial [Planctomycetaceae bacterium]|nr:hypothetical protein [Planctomycetaceae bacterium]